MAFNFIKPALRPIIAIPEVPRVLCRMTRFLSKVACFGTRPQIQLRRAAPSHPAEASRRTPTCMHIRAAVVATPNAAPDAERGAVPSCNR